MSTAAAIRPVQRTNLADSLAVEIQGLIGSGRYKVGERLPAIAEMARQYNVGPPTLREAIKRVEALGLVSVRHGSGVYVRSLAPPIFLTNPIHTGEPSRKLLLDLIEARMPIEIETARLAARNATPAQIGRMEQILTDASAAIGDAAVLAPLNMAFHRQIATASGNAVLAQLVEQIVELFRDEQLVILEIYGPRDRDHQEHLGLFDTIRSGDEARAGELMRAHLGGVRSAIERWDGAAPQSASARGAARRRAARLPDPSP